MTHVSAGGILPLSQIGRKLRPLPLVDAPAPSHYRYVTCAPPSHTFAHWSHPPIHHISRIRPNLPVSLLDIVTSWQTGCAAGHVTFGQLHPSTFCRVQLTADIDATTNWRSVPVRPTPIPRGLWHLTRWRRQPLKPVVLTLENRVSWSR